MKSLYPFSTRVQTASTLKLSESLATNRTISLSRSPLFLKSFALALAMLVVGIGNSWGQVNYAQNWDAVTTSGGWSTNWANTTSLPCQGTKAVRKNIYSSGTAGAFVSPLLGTSNGALVTMSFQYKITNWSAGTVATPNTFGTIQVQYGATATGPWTTPLTINNTNHTASTACATQNLTFTPPSGNLYVRFNCTYGAGDYWMYFDNVNITQAAGSACTGTPAPGNTISSSATVAPGGTVNLSLQNATSGSGVTYQWQSSATVGGTYANVIGGTGATTASYTTAALTTATWFRCRVTCGANTGVSNPVGVTLAYCTPTAVSDDATGITFVGFNTISNTSVGTPAYTNNTGISTSVFQNTAYPLTVRVNTAGTYTVNVLAWIDWNQNLTFEAGEQYNLGSANNVTDANTTASPFSITVPGTALLGNTVMRVRVTYNVAPTACGDQSYSEAEDYTITVQAIALASCPTLTSPADAATGVSLTPTLTWTAGANTSTYDVYLSTNQTDVNNQAVGALVSTSQAGTSYTSAALSPSTLYYWRVVPKNSSGTAATGCATRSFTTTAPSPTVSQSGSLSAFSACANVASAQQSFSVSGLYLSGDLVVTAPTGFSVSTTSGSGWASSVSLTPASGTVSSTLIYVRMNALASNPTSDNIVCSSTSASSVNVAVSGSVIAAPTVNAGSDFNMCSGQTIAMNASTNATGPTLSGTANSGSVSTSGTDNTFPTATYTFTGLPAGAVINGITVNISSAGGGNCPAWYSVTTRLNGVQQGVAGCATNTTYTNLNGQAANGLVVAVRGQDNDAWADAMTVTYTVTLNYTYVGNPTYAWSPATGLSATNVLNPSCSTTSTQTYTLTVTGGNGCSASDEVVATIAGAAPSTPTAAVSGSSTINVGAAATLTSTAGANTVWYTTATGGTSVATGSPFTTAVQCTPGTITYYAEDNNGSCASAARGEVSFTVRPVVAANPANALICSTGGSVTLNTQLTGATLITWSPNTNLSTTSGSSTVASPAVTTVYTMNATVAGCGAVSSTQTVGVIDAVAFTPTSTPTAVCAGNPAVLASNLLSAGFTYSSMTFAPSTAVSPTVLCNACGVDDGSWNNVPIPFTYNFFGNNYTTVNVGSNGVLQFGSSAGLGQYTYNSGNFPNFAYPANVIAAAAVDLYFTSGSVRYFTDGIAPTRKFVIEYLGVAGFSGGSNTVQIKLCETTGIVEIHVTNASAFGGSANKVVGLQDLTQTIGATAYSNTATITNTAWKFIPGANYTFQWATAGSNVSGATSTGYTTPNLSTAGTVTYSVAATNPNTQCTTTQSVNVTVNALPAAPNSTGDLTACSTAGNQALTVSTGAGETADWFAAPTGGTVLASGDNVLTYSTATAGTYYAAAQNTTTGCSSASRTGVTLNVNASPAAPTVTTPVSYCQGATATTLTATATGENTLNWYSAAPSYPSYAGATALGSAPTPSTSTAGTTNYYVSQSSSSNSCESELALVAVTVNATPSAPVASNPSAYCLNDIAVALTATATAGNTLYWYTVPTGGTGTEIAPIPSTNAAGTTNYYVADRTNASGCEGSRTTVTVTVNPSITAAVSNSASSTSACGGGSITFTATPTNGGTPTYQWYLNASAVSGETNATYTLATPNDADAIYVEMTPSAQTCLASNAATASNTVTLTSTAATPTVSIQSSASTAFCPGTSVTFSVNASANMGATPSYQWNMNGTPINGATNSTLVTTSLANNDQVTLTMTSSLSAGCLTQSSATSSSITSTVNSATVISTQPTAAAACLGGSQSYTVSATGTGTLTYQWKKDGSNVTGNATATSSTLTLSGIAAGDAANYTVDVTGTCGTVTSSAAALTINSATAISTQPSAASDCAGATVNFSVTASGQGTLTYQWRKDGSALNGETNAALAVTNISAANAGQYSVIVSGGCGNVTSSNALLAINAATVISTQPAALTLCAGNTANFSVTASGTGTLSYQWKKDGSNVGTNSSTLSIANAQEVNAGNYTVDVTGTCGTVTSSTALLTVNPLTTITTQPVAAFGCQGQSSTFTVVAAGTSPLTYQWKFGGVNISGATAASYNIPNATTENDGGYLVTVTGGCGAAVNSNTVVLDVYPTSVAGTVGSNQAICSGNSPANLTLTGNTGTIQWQSSLDNSTFANIGGATASTLTSAEMGTLNATTYYIAIVTSGSCSSATTNTVTVTVTASPSAGTISGSQAICSNGTTQFVSTGDAGGTWTSSSEAVSTVNSSGLVTAVSAGTATITYTVSGTGGCAGSATRTVTVTATPSTPSVSVADGCGLSTLSFTPASNATIAWSNGGTTASTTSTTNATLTVTQSVNGCLSSAGSGSAVPLVVPTAPTATASQNFCITDNATVASLAYSSVVGNTYTWYDAATSGNAVATSTQLPTATTNYYLETTASNGCASSTRTTVTATETALALATISIVGTTTCLGGEITFTATPANGGNSPTYQWYNGGVPILNATGNTYIATGLTEGDLITVKMIPSGSCVTVCPN